MTFGGTAATNVVVVNGTQITATTPAHAAGAVTVTVTVNGQSGSLAQRVHLQRAGGDRFRAGGGGHAAVSDGDGFSDVSGSPDGGRSKRSGGGMERHHLDGAVGKG